MSQDAMVQFSGWVAGTGRDGAILNGYPELDGQLYCLQSGGSWKDGWALTCK